MAKSIVSSDACTLARISISYQATKQLVCWYLWNHLHFGLSALPPSSVTLKPTAWKDKKVWKCMRPDHLWKPGFLGKTHLCVHPLTERGIMPVGLTMCGRLNQFNLEQRNVWNSYTISISNFAVTKVGSTIIPAFMSQSTSLFQTIFLTLEISSSHWSWAPVIGCFICLFVVCFDQRDRLWVPLMWGLSVIQNGSVGTGECPSWLIPNSVLLEPHPIKQ